ncbi:hypothetical protein Tco_1130712, partial [Tanacetum coccineum]
MIVIADLEVSGVEFRLRSCLLIVDLVAIGTSLELFKVDGLHSTWSLCNVVFSIFVPCVMIDHYVAFPSFRHCRGVTDWIYVRGVMLLCTFVCSWFGSLLMSVTEMGGLILIMNGKRCEYKYGGQRNYKRITTHSYLVLLFTQIDVDTIMPPRMITRSAGRPAAISLGGGTGNGPSNQGNVRNQNGNVVNGNVQENVGNVIVNGNRVGCSYNEFLACNPKEYDGKEGAVVLTCWIDKIESVHDMSGCSVNQKVKYIAGSFVGKALTWWNSQIRTLSREVAVS